MQRTVGDYKRQAKAIAAQAGIPLPVSSKARRHVYHTFKVLSEEVTLLHSPIALRLAVENYGKSFEEILAIARKLIQNPSNRGISGEWATVNRDRPYQQRGDAQI